MLLLCNVFPFLINCICFSLHMFWGSYVKESRDRPRLSVHLNFVCWSLTLGCVFVFGGGT
jgi:hypothetical protein